MQVVIPPQIFYGHTQKLLDTWIKKHENTFDSIIIVNGKTSPGNEKTVAILSWFLAGYNLADTILFFTKEQVVVYTSERKINYLNNIANDPNAKKYNLTFVKKEDDNIAAYQKIWAGLHKGVDKPRVGTLLNDTRVGATAEDFDKFLKQTSHEGVEALTFFNSCFEQKDAKQLENIRKSGRVTAYFQQKFIKQAEKVIDSARRIKHKELTEKIAEIMGNQAEMKKLHVKLKEFDLNKDYIDNGPPASIQSGGNYKHKLFAEADDAQLRSDCIILSLGSLYRSYNTYVSRTLLIDPTDYQKNIYKKVEMLSKIVTQNLKVGVKLSDVYKRAKMFVEEHLKVDMPKSLGFGIGIFLKESSLGITQSTEKVVEVGNVFLVDLTFVDIEYEAKKGGKKKFGVQLIDTVVVEEKGQETVTGAVSKALADISYSLDDDQEDDRKKQRKDLPQQSNIIEGSRRRRHRNEVAQQRLKGQKQRNEHQKKLKMQKLEELKQRQNENFSGDLKKQVMVEASRIQAYKSREELPKQSMKKNMIYVDHKNNAILLPIKGSHIPFHILLLKSVVKSDEGKFASLRFNFHLPNSISNLTFPKFSQPSIFVKEIVFRSQQVARFADIEKQVKALQKKIRTETSEKNAKEDIVEQEKLNVNRGKRPILRDLFPRPAVGQKKTKGNLQCHLNGFRYTTSKGESIDIAFSNIKFAFFQPCQNQIIAAIHFRLHEPILVAKKKTEDIQFYSQGGTSAEDVVGRGRGMRQDSDDEERQKDARKKVDREFIAWTKACQEFIGGQFTFEIPDRNKGFYGTPFKGNCLIQPTRTCLINVTEIPFFILNLKDIEVACFERMYANLRSFDVTFVFKDYENHIRVNSIPIKDVERVKDFLDDHGIIFYDLGKSMNWAKFLAGIRYDFKKFVEDGAWTAWDDEEGDEQPMSEGDSEFAAEEEQLDEADSEQSDSDEEASGHDEDDSDDDDDSEEDEEDLDEEGLSWDELEERAEKEDRDKLRRDIEKENLIVRKKR